MASSSLRSSTRLASSAVISSLTAAPGTPDLIASISLRTSRSVFSRSRCGSVGRLGWPSAG